MNWEEKADGHANAHHTYEHLGYGENMRFHKMFVKGAEWQRDQLRTDEAVERVALWLTGMLTPFEDWPSNEDLEGGPAGDRDVEFKEAWMKEARAAINALLGGET